MSQLSGLCMRNFSDLMCLPKSREEKVTEGNEGKDKVDPYTAFNMAVGWKPITLWVRRGWANFKVKTYGLKKKFFYFTL